MVSVLPYAIVAGVLPSFIWLLFWLREDIEHPEPRSMILLSFVGGAMAVIVSVMAEKFTADIFFDQTARYVSWAAIEELSKLIVIAFVALDSRYNDEPIDAMVYLVTIALGFSAIENTLFILSPFSSGQIAAGLATGSMRFIGATLVHVVSSAIIGFSLGLAFYRGKFTKALYLIGGVILAVFLHSLFNLFIISSDALDMVKIFAWLWVAVVIILLLFEEVKAVKPKLSQN